MSGIDKLEKLLSSKALTTVPKLHDHDFPAGLRQIYDACNSHLRGESGGIECFTVSKRIKIPTAPLRRKLGLVD